MVREAGSKRSPGRPGKFPGEGARIGHSLRIKPSVDRIVRAAAEKNCRSISEEIENRLNQTIEKAFIAFDDDQLLARIREDATANKREVWFEAQMKIRNAICIEDIFENRGTYALFMLIAKDFAEYDRKCGTSLMQSLEDQRQGSVVYQQLLDLVGNRLKAEVEQSRKLNELISERNTRDEIATGSTIADAEHLSRLKLG